MSSEKLYTIFSEIKTEYTKIQPYAAQDKIPQLIKDLSEHKTKELNDQEVSELLNQLVASRDNREVLKIFLAGYLMYGGLPAEKVRLIRKLDNNRTLPQG